VDERLAEQSLRREVARLERQQAKLAARDDNADAMQFTVHATCPPSVGFYVHGGRMVMPPSWDSSCFFVNSGVVDLTTYDLDYWPYTFTNANWYLPLYATIGWYYVAWDQGYVDMQDTVRFHGATTGPGFGYSGGGFVEYETAAEAEQSLSGADYIQDYICETGEPLCKLILMNNGNTAESNQFRPVDAVNRGRSYLFGLFRNGRMMMP
jgi:hypothetical protein